MTGNMILAKRVFDEDYKYNKKIIIKKNVVFDRQSTIYTKRFLAKDHK